jgi:hypothetical protein
MRQAGFWLLTTITLCFTILLTPGVLRGETGEPAISVHRLNLCFGAQQYSDLRTAPQPLIVTNSGTGILKWAALKIPISGAEEPNWLRLAKDIEGLNTGMVEVSVDHFGLAPGSYVGGIAITPTNDDNLTPLVVEVTLTVFPSNSDIAPFGSFDTPINGATYSGSVAVTGWALDDYGIQNISIWRAPVSGEYGDLIFIGNATIVENARPDVELAHLDYPLNYKAGWGYMLLTNALPNYGNGTFTLYAYANDYTENITLLGTKTIVCNNANAVNPFGAIDTPEQGGLASGVSYRNQGWALTPQPNYIPTDASTMWVYIDGKYVGQPTYNIYRYDIAALFPGYANSNGAMAVFDFDTTVYSIGSHTIQWTVRDNAGNTEGIGSRFFTTLKSFGYQERQSSPNQALSGQAIFTPPATGIQFEMLSKLPVNLSNGIRIKTGYGTEPAERFLPNNDGYIKTGIQQDQRLVLQMQPGEIIKAGYMKVGDNFRALPVGSSLDAEAGTFYWQTGLGYFGSFDLVFLVEDPSGRITRRNITVTIGAK